MYMSRESEESKIQVFQSRDPSNTVARGQLRDRDVCRETRVGFCVGSLSYKWKRLKRRSGGHSLYFPAAAKLSAPRTISQARSMVSHNSGSWRPRAAIFCHSSFTCAACVVRVWRFDDAEEQRYEDS